jgi:hypothetical protein
MAKKTKSQQPPLTIGCKFNNVLFSDELCKIGIRIGRDKLTLVTASDYLCGRSLTVNLYAEPGKPETATLPGAESPIELTLNVDCKSFNVKSKSITFGLTTMRKELEKNLTTFAKFAQREGRIEINKVEDLEETAEDEDKE